MEEIIEEDLENGKYKTIVTRFPPEPNGYLHIGHASSICLNFGLTKKYPGYTNLRFDDTNPVTEETEYVDSIKEDIRWLGFEWKNELYASIILMSLYEYAVKLIKKGLAYVDDSSSEEMAADKRHAYRAGKEQSIPRPEHRRKSGSVYKNESRRISRWQPNTAGKNRYGAYQYADA